MILKFVTPNFVWWGRRDLDKILRNTEVWWNAEDSHPLFAAIIVSLMKRESHCQTLDMSKKIPLYSNIFIFIIQRNVNISNITRGKQI